jgi:glycine oxidase
LAFLSLRRLDEVRRYDAIVVGSGVIGLCCAWRLSTTGRRVAVFDPRPGSGSSAVGAGMLAPATEASWHDTTLVELNMRAARDWPAFAAELEEKSGVATGFRPCGTVYAAFDSSDKTALEEICEFERSLGLDATWFGPTQLRRFTPQLSPSVRGGIWAPGEHQVDNRRLVAALEAALFTCGVRRIARRVDGVLIDSGAVSAVTSEGARYEVPLVVLALGHRAHSLTGIPGGVVPEIRPVKGQILRLRSRDGARFGDANVRGLIKGEPVYVVSRDDGGVVVGATQEEKGEDVTVDADALYRLLRNARSVLPGIDDLGVVEVSAGLRPAAKDHLPVIGESSIAGLVLALGHFRNGILLADVTAKAIVALCEDGELPDWSAAFRPDRLKEPVTI